MKYLSRFYTLLFIVLLLASCNNEAPVSSEQSEQVKVLRKTTVRKADVVAFQPAGDFGGGVLTPGTFFPPTNGGFSTLKRGSDWISYNLHTTGLPSGAYTNWWVIINNPEACTDGVCDEADVFENPATNSSVFWATGGIVEKNGVGNFSARIEVGELPTGQDQFVFGLGLVNPATAEVHIIVKYHGPASDDPNELYLQTNTLTGLCDQGANGYDLGPPFGVQCFDPQVSVHKSPQNP